MRKITISELARKNKEHGGVFFDKTSMKMAGETLKSFKVVLHNEQIIRVERQTDGKLFKFCSKTFRLVPGGIERK